MPMPSRPISSTQLPADVHPGDQAAAVTTVAADRPTGQRRTDVPDDDAAPRGRPEQQAPGEPRVEVAGDPEAREHAGQGRRLQEREDEAKAV